MTIKGMTIAIGADVKQFNKQMKAVDKTIKTTTKQVDELTKSLEMDFDNDKFILAQKLAQDALKDTEDKVEALRLQLKYLEEQGLTEKHASQYQNLQYELYKTENSVNSLRESISKLNSMNIDKFSENMKNAGEAISNLGKKMKPVSIAAGAVLGGLSAIGLSAVSTGAELDDMSQQINMSAEELQKWQYIAMQTGVENKELQTSFIRLQNSFGKMATGEVNKTTEALMALGISVEDAALGMSHNFNTIIERLQQIEDPMLQAGYASELFGAIMGSKLIPMLNAGGEGLAQLLKEFESLGYLTNEQVKNLADFDDTLNRIKYSFKNIKDQIGTSLLPLMQAISDFIETKVVPAVQKLSDWFSSLSLDQQKYIVGALALVAALAPVLMGIGKLTSAVGALTSSAGALSKALTFLAAHPIIAVIMVIVGLITLLYAKNEEFRESVNNLISSLGQALMPILNALGKAFSGIFKALMPIVDMLAIVLVPVINIISTVITAIVELLSKIFVPLIEKIGSLWAKVFGAMPNILFKILEGIEWVVNGVINLINTLIRGLNSVGEYLGFTIGEIKNVTFAGDIKHKFEQSQAKSTNVSDTSSATPKVEDVVGKTPYQVQNNTNITNDNSVKHITVNLTIENYNDELDYDEILTNINARLAEQM